MHECVRRIAAPILLGIGHARPTLIPRAGQGGRRPLEDRVDSQPVDSLREEDASSQADPRTRLYRDRSYDEWIGQNADDHVVAAGGKEA
jgi:hypothetical protein